MKFLPEIFGLICVLAGFATKSHALYLSNGESVEYCMDKHGSAYSAPHCDNRDITPEYMYNTRDQQMQMNQLNVLSAQALENIARASTPLPSSSITTLSNDQQQAQDQRSNNNANANSRSRSNAINSNSNSNTNTNTNIPIVGVFN